MQHHSYYTKGTIGTRTNELRSILKLFSDLYHANLSRLSAICGVGFEGRFGETLASLILICASFNFAICQQITNLCFKDAGYNLRDTELLAGPVVYYMLTNISRGLKVSWSPSSGRQEPLEKLSMREPNPLGAVLRSNISQFCHSLFKYITILTMRTTRNC